MRPHKSFQDVLRWRAASASFLAVVALSAIACACNVPVFRYALERWRPDVYRVTLIHRGPLNESQRELVRQLEEAQDRGLANFVIHEVDVNDHAKPAEDDGVSPAALPDLVRSRLDNDEPWVVVQYPPHLRVEVPVWAGPLASKTIERLTDSPVRRELVRRLADGQTAVWLLLESGNAEKDQAAAELLAGELDQLQQSLKLPELTSDPADELLASTPLKVAFSVLRVPHGAAEEEALAGMLVRCEPDLADRTDPIVYPVFGRGRALLPLIGAGISAENIHDASEFLVGACSCQVKELNPGFDLLLTADWDALLSHDGQRLAVVQTRGLLPADGAAELVPIPGGTPTPTIAVAPPLAASSPRNAWYVMGGLLAAGLAFAILLSALHAGSRAH